MAGDSYSLDEVSALLGVPVPDLVRRIEDGAFPGRFLTADWEMRIPVQDVRRAVDAMRRSRPSARAESGRPERALVARGGEGGALVDVAELRSTLEAWWDDREARLIGEIRQVLDREDERWTMVEAVLTEVRDRLARIEASGLDRADALATEGWASAFDELPATSAESVLAELRELEQVLGLSDPSEG
jgi:hypothetical protein